MRLGFHYHIPAQIINKKIYTQGALGCFLDSLALYCDQLVCFMHSPVGAETDLLDYPLKNENISLVDVGLHSTVPKRMLAANKVKKTVQNKCSQLDAMLIRSPSPLLPVIASICEELPVVLLIVGDYMAGIDDLPQLWWRKELIRLWSWWYSKKQLRIAKQSLTFVNSHELYRQLESKVPKLIETRTTTLSIDDFFCREDTCNQTPIRLLYTGRMDRAKGLLDIFEAVRILNEMDVNIIFDLVGMAVKGDPVLEEISEKSKKYGLQNKVKFHGYIPLGPDLFQFYKQADIYIIASQNSEGFPRSIWEAMVHSLPVIATRVGSIPDYIEDSACLVKPMSPGELVNGILRIINNQGYRKQIIKSGFQLAKQNTLEIRAKEMITSIEDYLTYFNFENTNK
jgi:glycosyltransferase involved in cell wall biosynthesis